MATQAVRQQTSTGISFNVGGIGHKVNRFFTTLLDAFEPYLGPGLIDCLDERHRRKMSVHDKAMLDADFMGLRRM